MLYTIKKKKKSCAKWNKCVLRNIVRVIRAQKALAYPLGTPGNPQEKGKYSVILTIKERILRSSPFSFTLHSA